MLELTGLPTTEALRANNGTFTVNVLIKPRLQGPHLFRLLLDDQPYGQPSNVPILQLVNIDRGDTQPRGAGDRWGKHRSAKSHRDVHRTTGA